MDASVTAYRNGRRVAEPLPLDRAFEVSREPDTFVWIDLLYPHEDVLESLQSAFGLQRPRPVRALQAPPLALARCVTV
jgi:Mg2+ and Co2+ transporter CorA